MHPIYEPRHYKAGLRALSNSENCRAAHVCLCDSEHTLLL